MTIVWHQNLLYSSKSLHKYAGTIKMLLKKLAVYCYICSARIDAKTSPILSECPATSRTFMLKIKPLHTTNGVVIQSLRVGSPIRFRVMRQNKIVQLERCRGQPWSVDSAGLSTLRLALSASVQLLKVRKIVSHNHYALFCEDSTSGVVSSIVLKARSSNTVKICIAGRGHLGQALQNSIAGQLLSVSVKA